MGDGTDWMERVRLLQVVASEAVEETDAIERHPEVIDALRGLADFEDLNDYFGGNGHDPNAYAETLASALEPYTAQPLDDAPELVGSLAFFAWALSERRTPEALAEMQVFS